MDKRKVVASGAVLSVPIALAVQTLVPPDWSGLGVQVIQLLVPIVTTVVIYYARKVLDFIPTQLVPILAVVVGVGVDALRAWVVSGKFNLFISALLGAAATWLYEAVKQWMNPAPEEVNFKKSR